MNKSRTIHPSLTWLIALLLTASSLLMGGCATDDEINSAPGPGEENNLPELTLEVRIPGILTPKTYSMSTTDEEKIGELTLLVYKDVSGNKLLDQKYKLASSDFTDHKNGSMTAKVNIQTGKYDCLVLIANANTKLEGISVNSDITQLSTLEYANNTGAWDAATSIPMSALLEAPATNGLDITNSRTFKGLVLTRMLARVDIVNRAAANFTLNKVHLYNMNSNGYILSDKTKYEASPKQPNLPGTLTKIANPLTYNFSTLATGTTMEREMYIFEAAEPTMAGIAASARIILEGTYNNQTYFYPIDFTYPATDGGVTKGDFIPVLRNHKYVFTINKVSGAGYTAANDALNAQASFTNIDVKVLVIDDDFTDVYYNGKNFLAVNTTGVRMMLGNANYTTAQEANTLTVLTDASAFTIECYNNDDTSAGTWLEPNAVSYAGGSKVSAFLKSAYIAANMGLEKEGYIIVKAGGLQSDKIPVMKVVCGKDGIPLKQDIGGGRGEYLTHRFPTGPSGAMQCWMVENLRYSNSNNNLEDAFALYYGDGGKSIITSWTGTDHAMDGYYYTWSHATNACPDGTTGADGSGNWVMPKLTEVENLKNAADTSWATGSYKQFWGENNATVSALAGRHGIQYAEWQEWGANGYWFHSSIQDGYFHATSDGIGDMNFKSAYYFSVRCLQR